MHNVTSAICYGTMRINPRYKYIVSHPKKTTTTTTKRQQHKIIINRGKGRREYNKY